jgi:hypothetical protein
MFSAASLSPRRQVGGEDALQLVAGRGRLRLGC